MRASVVGLAKRLCCAALPIGGACERDRIAGALADLGEVCKRGAGIIEESQRNPAGGELLLSSIVLPARHGGGARDAIRGLGVAEVEQRSGDKPPLDPPLVGVERLRRIVGDRQHQFGGFRRLLLATQPLGAAEDIADVAARFRRHPVQLRLRVGRFFDDRYSGLGNNRRVAAGAIG